MSLKDLVRAKKLALSCSQIIGAVSQSRNWCSIAVKKLVLYRSEEIIALSQSRNWCSIAVKKLVLYRSHAASKKTRRAA